MNVGNSFSSTDLLDLRDVANKLQAMGLDDDATVVRRASNFLAELRDSIDRDTHRRQLQEKSVAEQLKHEQMKAELSYKQSQLLASIRSGQK